MLDGNCLKIPLIQASGQVPWRVISVGGGPILSTLIGNGAMSLPRSITKPLGSTLAPTPAPERLNASAAARFTS